MNIRKAKARNFNKNSNGSIAVEMAFVLPILIFLIFSIIEFSIVFFLSSRIESAANDAARLGMTGNLYGAVSRKILIEKKVEDDLSKVIFNFNKTKLKVKITSLNDYKIQSGVDTDPNNFGAGGEFSLYEVYYNWSLLSPLLSYGLGDSNGIHKITARVIVKNEEF